MEQRKVLIFSIKKIVIKVNIPLVVSGGVSNIKDIRKLHKAELFDGVIIGKAIL
jgi:phosphoribosylformimino-5-aminoimidazole carboxamide ribonucleotide (ProFAR) isomerase